MHGWEDEERERRGEEGGEVEEGKGEKSLRKRLQVSCLVLSVEEASGVCPSVYCTPVWHSQSSQRPGVQEEMQSVNRGEVTITLAPTSTTRMRPHAGETGVAGK